jgi:hypothetical protein
MNPPEQDRVVAKTNQNAQNLLEELHKIATSENPSCTEQKTAKTLTHPQGYPLSLVSFPTLPSLSSSAT